MYPNYTEPGRAESFTNSKDLEDNTEDRAKQRDPELQENEIQIICVDLIPEDDEAIPAAPGFCTHSLGILLAFVSGIFMTAYSSMIKLLVDMDSMQVVVIRGAIQLILMGGLAIYKKNSFLGPRERNPTIFMFLVALTGGLRLLFIFTSFSRLPLGDSTTIVFSSPIFVMIFSICILKV